MTSTTHTQSGSSHAFSATVTYINEEPPPPEFEVDHDPIDKEFYEDFRAALLANRPIVTNYADSAGKPVTGTSFS